MLCGRTSASCGGSSARSARILRSGRSAGRAMRWRKCHAEEDALALYRCGHGGVYGGGSDAAVLRESVELPYLEADMLMECEICHKKENSKTRCVNGHYVCNECHTQGLDRIIELCMTSTLRDPIAIIEQMMALPTCHMHGPEHHVMVGAALLTAYHNAGGDIDLRSALTEMMNRGRSVSGGACGFWGACGAGISTGMFVSIISPSTPLANEPFALSHKMTAKSLQAISEIGGPRCCKRDSFLSILAAIDFVREQFGIEMEKPEVVCHYSAQNNQCIGKRCPFSKVNH